MCSTLLSLLWSFFTTLLTARLPSKNNRNQTAEQIYSNNSCFKFEKEAWEENESVVSFFREKYSHSAVTTSRLAGLWSYFCRGGFHSKSATRLDKYPPPFITDRAIRRARVTENTPSRRNLFPSRSRIRRSSISSVKVKRTRWVPHLSLSLSPSPSHIVVWHNRRSLDFWNLVCSRVTRYYAKSYSCLVVAILPSWWWLIVHLAETTWLLLLNEFLDLSSGVFLTELFLAGWLACAAAAVVALWRVSPLLTGGSRALERDARETRFKREKKERNVRGQGGGEVVG